MTYTIEVHVHDDDLDAVLRSDARAGLTRVPKELPPKYFYDERGSCLFEEITCLEEYYPTRREREILLARAAEIAAITAADTLIELGSGSSEKTRVLLSALTARGTLERYVPFDVSETALREAASAIASEYHVDVHAIAGDFERHLETIPGDGRKLIAFLGGTIGNLYPDERATFLKTVASRMRPGDTFLLGTDLVKDRAVLELAYNDPAGVTAAFNLNMLSVLNSRLDAEFVLDDFQHVAVFDERNAWIAISLRARRDVTVPVRALGLEVSFEEGEEMRTEISAKFTRDRVRKELAAAGLALTRWWTDPHGDFALSLSAVS